MPLEFTDAEQPGAPRRGLAGKALAAIIVAALVGAAGVYGTVMVVNSFTNRTIDRIVEDVDCSRYEIHEEVPDGEVTFEMMQTIARFSTEYVLFVALSGGDAEGTTWDEDLPVAIAALPARYEDDWVILAYLPDIARAGELPERYEGYPVHSCLASVGPDHPPLFESGAR